jgi:hypothetical protein
MRLLIPISASFKYALGSYNFLLPTSFSIFNDYFQKSSVVFEPAFELGNFDLLSHFAKNNFGIACVIKNFTSEDFEFGRLFEIELFEKIPPREVCIAQLNSTDPSPAAKELMRLMTYNKSFLTTNHSKG